MSPEGVIVPPVDVAVYAKPPSRPCDTFESMDHLSVWPASASLTARSALRLEEESWHSTRLWIGPLTNEGAISVLTTRTTLLL